MGALTIYEALVGELEPYTPSPATLKKAMLDVGIADDGGGAYGLGDKRTVARAAIIILKKMIVLSSDSLGKSSQGYNIDALKRRINDLCIDNSIDASDIVEASTISNGSNMW